MERGGLSSTQGQSSKGLELVGQAQPKHYKETGWGGDSGGVGRGGSRRCPKPSWPPRPITKPCSSPTPPRRPLGPCEALLPILSSPREAPRRADTSPGWIKIGSALAPQREISPSARLCGRSGPPGDARSLSCGEGATTATAATLRPARGVSAGSWGAPRS